jgi:uncharacterized membrane protein YhiD involved in acid resistance
MNSINLDTLTQSLPFIYSPDQIIMNLIAAAVLGVAISSVYRVTHRGLSYSQSFMLTIVFVTIIVSMVIMVIGNNLARAFALVGALSIIRFRTVVKDTKDTAYIFLALAAGLGAGTSNYFLAFVGSTFVLAVAYVLHLTNYGSIFKSEFLLRFRSPTTAGEQTSRVIQEYARTSNLLNVEAAGDGATNMMTFDIVMKPDKEPEMLSSDLSQLEGISEVVIVASKSDVDY